VQAVVFEGPFKLAENLEDPRTGDPGDTVARVRTTGNCGPDLRPRPGQAPLAGESARLWVAGADRGSAGA